MGLSFIINNPCSYCWISKHNVINQSQLKTGKVINMGWAVCFYSIDQQAMQFLLATLKRRRQAGTMP